MDHARPALLGELVRALLPEHPGLEVHTEVQRVLDVPHGSTLVLVPRAEDSDWLNINRPVFAQRELRVVLFCDTETTIALARQAVDFFDWISHRVECPNRPPSFAVAGIRCALAARAPGIVWRGGDLEAAFTAARPRGKLHKVSASRPYSEMLAEVQQHRGAWLAWTDIDSQFRLRRVRWALAEAGHRTRAILVEPTVSSPGWWPVHARLQDVREARGLLEKAGASHPGRVAALNELEPEAITLMQSLLEDGLDDPTLDATLMIVNSLEGATSPFLEATSRQFARGFMRGEAPPPITRAFKPEYIRHLCRKELSGITNRLERSEQVGSKDLASWTAWVGTLPSSLRPTPLNLDLATHSPEYAIELLLRSRAPEAHSWNAQAILALSTLDQDVATIWAQRMMSSTSPYDRLLLATVQSMQGRHDEAESLVRDLLPNGEHTTEQDRFLQEVLPLHLASALQGQRRHQDAEALLRQALSSSEHSAEPEAPILHEALTHELATSLREQGRYQEAESLLQQALSSSKNAQGLALIYRGLQLTELASVLRAQGNYAEAEAQQRQALSTIELTMGSGHPFYGSSLYRLAVLLRLQGKNAEAEPLLRQSLSTLEQELGAGHPSFVGPLHALALALGTQGKYDEAEATERQALALIERTLGSEHFSYGMSLHGLATLLQAQGRYAEAESTSRQALAITERALSPTASELFPLLKTLGTVLTQQGNPEAGEPFVARAVDIARGAYGPNHPETAKAMNLLAQLQALSGNGEAPETARRALDALTHALGSVHPITQRAMPVLQTIISADPRTHEED